MSKIVNPNDETHTIKLVGRFVASDILTVFLTNKTTNVTTEVVGVFAFGNNEVSTFVFGFDFKERDSFQIKIAQGADVFYRGKIFATSQPAQDFDILKDFIQV